ncbi:MAG TPA: hypothetical protein VIO35_06900 [Chloroflexota bacterium]
MRADRRLSPFDKVGAKLRYWNIVVECLVEIFGFSPAEAREKVDSLQTRIEGRRAADLFYHAEPLDVASDLAGVQLDADLVTHHYAAILHRRELDSTGALRRISHSS